MRHSIRDGSLTDRQDTPEAVIQWSRKERLFCPNRCRSERRCRNMNGRPKLESPKEPLSVWEWVKPAFRKCVLANVTVVTK